MSERAAAVHPYCKPCSSPCPAPLGAPPRLQLGSAASLAMQNDAPSRSITPYLGLIDDDEEEFDPVLIDLKRRLAQDTQLAHSRLTGPLSFDKLNADIESRLLSGPELRVMQQHRNSRPATASTNYRSPLRRNLSSAGSMRSLDRQREPSRRMVNDPHFSPGIMAMERKYEKLPSLPAGAKWRELRTDTPWVSTVPNQLDTRCEALRHAEKLLPKGNSAMERRAKAKRLVSSPLRQPRGPARYAPPEASRHALANSRPPAHDLLYRKASMPVARYMLDRYY